MSKSINTSTSQELHVRLQEAYTEVNLNRITTNIISLYKNREYTHLRSMINLLSEYGVIENKKINKCFNRLIMLYHPDRVKFYQNEINSCIQSGDKQRLQKLTHIFSVLDMDISMDNINTDVIDCDYSPEYEWDYHETGFGYFYDNADAENYYSPIDFYDNNPLDNSFMAAMKRKIYGCIHIDFPVYILEDMEELEMAEYELETLEGIEYCRFLKVLNLSGNLLTDISDLYVLKNLRELDISYNQIGYIDALVFLKYLVHLDISNNYIDDLSPLYDLQYLRSVDISGNPVSRAQINYLKNKGIALTM